MNPAFEIRPKPRKGTVLRVRLNDGFYYYACQVSSTSLWLYRFRTSHPACGSEFFPRADWKWGLCVCFLSSNFVNCGLLKLEGLPYTYTPVFYELVPNEEAERRGFRHNTVICKAWDTSETREVTPEEIHEKGYGLGRFMEDEYEKVISQYIPQMELREVPAKFLDKRDPASLRKTEKKPQTLIVSIILREAELATDDVEPDIEEPLEEAVEDAECGSFYSSGTEPGGLFVIEIETTTSTRAKCLKVVERTLRKLGCLNAATIEVTEAQ
jgi:hypothetical protein